MVRSLPKKHNPFILPDQSPSYEDLLALRRLGKTNLAVKPTQIGTSNATKPENLGPFEYAHLRAKLPDDLKGSEIFPWHTTQQSDPYFLMRRSKDGYISATGMFKIAFPWAKLEEEKAEREYLKNRKETSEDEIAGNIWISPTLALELAKEYQMYNWVRALLDPTEIPQTPEKPITPPPKFDLPAIEAPTQLAAPTPRTRRGRSASPSKRVLSPRKPRKTRAAKEASIEEASAASASLQSALEMTASNVEVEPVNGTIEPITEELVEEEKVVSITEETIRPSKSSATKKVQPIPEEKEEELEEEKVKVDIKTIADTTDDVRTTQTTISVEMPISLPEAPSTEETEQMIAKAKEMVGEAIKIQAAEGEQAESLALRPATKRKTDVLSEDEEDEETKAASVLRAKRARVLEEKLKRERVRNRALVGVSAVFALAASIPYFF